MSETSRLGAPVELPWWVLPLGTPPLVVAILVPFLGAPIPVRVLAAAASLVMVAVLLWVALRVTSRNLQSVWISAAYAIWFTVAFGWAVAVLGPAAFGVGAGRGG
ncbi:MAG: hypothetical protein ABR541_00300 [Candidatus Dormibacteria bacterium]